MNDIRRSLLWAVFGISVVMLWDAWQVHNGNAPLFFNQPAKTTQAATQEGGLPSPRATASAPAADGSNLEAKPAAQELTTVKTDVLDLVFDSAGGNLVQAKLLKYAQGLGGHNGKDFEPLTLLQQTPEHTYVVQSGLINGNFPNHTTVMTRVPGPTVLADGQDSLQIAFESPAIGGLKLVKTYTARRGSYVLDVRHELQNVSDAPLQPQLYVQLLRDNSSAESETPFYQTFTGPAFYSDEAKYEKVQFEDIAKGKAEFMVNTKSGFVAMVQHYFTTAWLLPEGQVRDNFARKLKGDLYSAGSVADLETVAPGATLAVDARLFVGPQQETLLESLTIGLDLVKDYGWVTILAKPLYWLLDKIHSVVGNWGWAIVLLVVVIKAAFYWLNAKAYRSMGKMKALSPRIADMRERLKDKPQQMQQEMMRIYKEEKVNPLGGCLPIMIQIPVFIALYWVLLSSVEMRNAPWIGWVADLSTKDPYFILPVVMTLTTFIQTALNPVPPDPLQAKLMWFMPLAFSVMFFFFPAGLVLYWITNNTLTILQQWQINKSMGVEMKFQLPKFK